MGRYANRTIRLDFPDLSEDDDPIYVLIRNPKTLPVDSLMPEEVPNGPDGKPDPAQAILASYGVMSGLVVDWHVYDGTDDSDDAPAMDLPATPEKIKSLPFEILQKLADQIGQVLTTPR